MGRLFPFYKFARGSTPVTYRHLIERPGGPLGAGIRMAEQAREDSDVPLPDYLSETLAIPFGGTADSPGTSPGSD